MFGELINRIEALIAGQWSHMDETESAPDPELYVDAFARGLSVIRAFDAEHPRLSLAEVAEAVNISRASARKSCNSAMHISLARL
jgi:IclR family transcriptional regulator, pca regulon regulatory protein